MSRRVIIAFTSWPNRINLIEKPLKSFMQLSSVTDVYLTLSLCEFPNREKDLPQFILDALNSSNMFHILWVEKNEKSFKKSLYVSDIFDDNDVIVSTDDDLIMPSRTIEKILKEYKCLLPLTLGGKTTITYTSKCVHSAMGVLLTYSPCMVSNWKTLLTDDILGTNNDDRFMMLLFWLNGYALKRYRYIRSRHIINNMVELSDPLTFDKSKYLKMSSELLLDIQSNAIKVDSVLDGIVYSRYGLHIEDAFNILNKINT